MTCEYSLGIIVIFLGRGFPSAFPSSLAIVHALIRRYNDNNM